MRLIHTERAPGSIGPYSQAVQAGPFLYISGQIGMKQEGTLVEVVREQTRQCLENLKAIVESAGGSLEQVIKTTVYLVDLSHFDEMNEVYGEYFKKHKPARATVEVSRLPKGALVEIEAIAFVGKPCH